jgi:hypothetical protein
MNDLFSVQDVGDKKSKRRVRVSGYVIGPPGWRSGASANDHRSQTVKWHGLSWAKNWRSELGRRHRCGRMSKPRVAEEIVKKVMVKKRG